MKVLFVHQNFPGQYKHIAAALADDPRNKVLAIGEKPNLGRLRHPRVTEIGYETPRGSAPATHHYVRNLENGVRRGQAVTRVAIELQRKGYTPDIICCHPAWGEGLYLGDIWPKSKRLYYFEFYYRTDGFDSSFDPEFPGNFDDTFRIHTKNAVNLFSLNAANWGMTPTRWQASSMPPEYRSRISVIHDGIDTDLVKPKPDITVTLPNGLRVSKSDEVITFVNRHLEPYRGFHTFMRTLPLILNRRKNAQVLIVGDDEPGYGAPAKDAKNHREKYLREVGDKLDLDRVHFLGRIPYDSFVKMLQLSAVHVYLTYPFVLSWSMLEAMSAGGLVVGSRTPPVEELITHGHNGLLVDFFKPREIADMVDRVLNHPNRMQEMRDEARKTIVDNYDLKTICLPKHLQLIKTLAAGKRPQVEAA